jgi:opacity protein-like surface antigen
MKRALLGLALAALLPVSAQAADNTGGLSYNYIEGGYAAANWGDGDFDGYSLAGSFGFADHWYGSASYRSVDENDFDVSLDETQINLGYHTAIQQNVDFIAELGYVNVGADIDGLGGDNSDGYRAAAGVRAMIAPSFELQGKVTYTDISDLDSSEFGVGVGATWHFNQTWGLTGSYEHTQLLDEGMDTWGLGVRATF